MYLPGFSCGNGRKGNLEMILAILSSDVGRTKGKYGKHDHISHISQHDWCCYHFLQPFWIVDFVSWLSMLQQRICQNVSIRLPLWENLYFYVPEEPVSSDVAGGKQFWEPSWYRTQKMAYNQRMPECLFQRALGSFSRVYLHTGGWRHGARYA